MEINTDTVAGNYSNAGLKCVCVEVCRKGNIRTDLGVCAEGD